MISIGAAKLPKMIEIDADKSFKARTGYMSQYMEQLMEKMKRNKKH